MHLRVQTPDGETLQHRAEGDEVTVGRSSSAHLSLSDRFLSRLHARFFTKDDDWWVEDLGSRNGTHVNDQKLDEPVRVRAGDTVRVSGCVITIKSEDPEKQSGSTDFGATIFRAASDLLHTESSQAVERSADDLRGYAERLRVLNEVHHALSRPISLKELLDLILDRAFEHVGCEEGAIFLREEDGSYERAAIRSTNTESGEYLYSETLLREVGDKGLAALVLDAGADERFRDAMSIMSSGVRSLVAAPLMDPEGSLGLIVLNSRLHRRQFTEDDMSLLTSLASVAALRIRNVALAIEAAERQRLEEELELARRIQVALLPASLPDIEGYALCGRNLPSRGVSGDFYEIVGRDEDYFLLVADVSGKGIAASLLTASFEALAAGPIEDGSPPEEVTARVSRRLFERTPLAKYATAWLGTLNPKSGVVRYTNAGHNPALHVRASGDVEQLGPTGVPVGLMEGSAYEAQEITLEPDDFLLVYTDGITESEDPDGEEFGMERLMEFCRGQREVTPDDLAAALEADLDKFTHGQPAADDRTVVVVRRALN
ncbi:MAG: SpoIIE family protein phosphatase [Thermoanaerobaculia bacterium]